jgi:hypothetical protein
MPWKWRTRVNAAFDGLREREQKAFPRAVGILQIPVLAAGALLMLGIWHMPQGPPENVALLGKLVRERRDVFEHDGRIRKFDGEGEWRKGVGELDKGGPRGVTVAEDAVDIGRAWDEEVIVGSRQGVLELGATG